MKPNLAGSRTKRRPRLNRLESTSIKSVRDILEVGARARESESYGTDLFERRVQDIYFGIRAIARMAEISIKEFLGFELRFDGDYLVNKRMLHFSERSCVRCGIAFVRKMKNRKFKMVVDQRTNLLS